MKKLTRTLLIATAGLLWALSATAQAPANNPGVMLQGFYYDSYNASNAKAANGESYGTTKWTDLTSQAQEIAETFDMIWLPPSAKSEGGTGYHPKQWSNQSSDWGTKAQLTTLIKKLKEINPNMKVIADIVINHKSGNNWIDFDNENFGTYGSFTLYESGHKSQYVCRDDEVSKQAGWTATGNKDAGYDYQCESSGGYCAARDLDHSNEYLRKAIKAYLQWMKGEIGYDGWRYDLVKGYLGKYTKEYNAAAGNYFSVGEYWDGSYDALTHWINETGKTSNAFDFCLKYNGFNNGLASKNYSALAGYGSGSGLIGDATYKQYAVTFVDNHDTFRDDNNKFWGDWTQANAYIIAMPGTPCVFYPHWVKCKNDIKKMAAARKACGITNTSSASCTSTGSYFRGEITGSKGKLVVFIGSQGTCPSGFKLACSGNGWAYYTTVPVDEDPSVTMTPAGGYATSVTLSATPSGATIYYTTDGNTPTTSSSKYTAAISVTNTNFTIKAIAVKDSKTSSVASGTYTNIEPEGITVQFKAPSNWSAVSLYVWDSEGKEILGEWPGKVLSKQGGAYSYTITETTTFPINLIFNDNNNGHQTVDLSTSADYCWDGTGMSGKKISPVKCGDTPVPGDTQYYVRVNGKTDYPAEDTGEDDLQGRKQYMAKVPLKVNDNITAYDKDNNAEFVISNLDPYGQYANFTASASGVKCNVAGCYEVYIKLKENNDMIYIGEGTGCTTDADDIEGIDGVTLVPNPTSGEMSLLSDKEFILGNVYTIGGKNCGTFEVYGNTIDVSRLAPSREPYQLLLIDANGGKSAAQFYKE